MACKQTFAGGDDGLENRAALRPLQALWRKLLPAARWNLYATP